MVEFTWTQALVLFESYVLAAGNGKRYIVLNPCVIRCYKVEFELPLALG